MSPLHDFKRSGRAFRDFERRGCYHFLTATQVYYSACLDAVAYFNGHFKTITKKKIRFRHSTNE